MYDQEMTDMELAMIDRWNSGINYFGPLTQYDQEGLDAYDRYYEAAEREHEEQQRAGGRTICPKCGQRSVKHSDAYTIGYPGHPGAEVSDYAVCEADGCDYAGLAG